MAETDGNLQLREARLGAAPPGSTLAFTLNKDKGFSVNALLECNMRVVATWESIEIAGVTTQEVLLPTGVYTLQVSIAYRGAEPADVELECSLIDDGITLKSKQLQFSGKKPDIGRAIVLLRIERP